MRWLIVSFAVALAPCAAWSDDETKHDQKTTQEETKADAAGKKQSRSSGSETQSSNPHPGEGASDDIDRTYGQYGTDPGTEARSEAKQSSKQPKKSTARQDEGSDGNTKTKRKGAKNQTSVARQPPSVVDNARRDERRIEGERSERSAAGGTSSEQSAPERGSAESSEQKSSTGKPEGSSGESSGGPPAGDSSQGGQNSRLGTVGGGER